MDCKVDVVEPEVPDVEVLGELVVPMDVAVPEVLGVLTDPDDVEEEEPDDVPPLAPPLPD